MCVKRHVIPGFLITPSDVYALGYCIELNTNGILFMKLILQTRKLYRGVYIGSVTGFPRGVRCRGLTTCVLYARPPFGYLFRRQWVSKFSIVKIVYFLFCIWLHIYSHNCK